MKKLLVALIVCASFGFAGRASADFPPWAQDGKVGNWMFNFKLGPAINAYPGTGFTQGAFVFDLGYAVTPDHNGYVTFSPAFQAGVGGTWVIVPVGFQYDIPIRSVPGLYLTPAVSVGFAAGVGGYGCSVYYNTVNGVACGYGTVAAFYFEPSFGGKYIFSKRWNVGFEPFSLPIFGSTYGAAVSYRILFYGGVNF